MKTIKELKKEFKQGKIAKADFITEMHGIHKMLNEYAEIIKDTDIEKIEIEDGSVVMTTREEGIKLICDKDDKRIIPLEIINFGAFEGEELKAISNLVKDGSTIFDIGANIGWYSLNFAKKFKSADIYAFEPVPKTFNYLTSHLAMNNATGVRPYNFGFSDEAKDVDIYFYPEGMGNASLVNLSENPSVETVKCKFITVDSFVKENNVPKVDFIKCDVEGAELFVFKGAIETLKRDKPAVFTEILRKWSAKFNYHPNDILDLFSDIGYDCYIIKGNTLEKFGKVDDQTMETNFVFIHKDKKA